MTPRWLYVLAAATPAKWGDPILRDEMLEPFDHGQLESGDVIGIGIHTGHAIAGNIGSSRRKEYRSQYAAGQCGSV